jgi:hypothetical protein
MLIALALGSLGIVAFLAGTIADKYRCADAVVGGRGTGCGEAGPGPGDPPARPASGAGTRSQTSLNFPPDVHPPQPKPIVLTPPELELGDPAERDRIARALTQRTAAATDDDVEYVLAGLRGLPLGVLQKLEQDGAKVVAARASVVEHFPSLAGVPIHPSMPKVTWDTGAAGLHDPRHLDPNAHTVVVAVEPARKKGTTVGHEAMHAFDVAVGDDSLSPEFKAARDKDRSRLFPPYLRDDDELALAESYAYSFDNYIKGDRARWPNLFDYWDCRLGGRCKGGELDPKPLGAP